MRVGQDRDAQHSHAVTGRHRLALAASPLSGSVAIRTSRTAYSMHREGT